MIKIVMDTDVLVAALRSASGASRLWLRAVLRREVVLLLSVPLVLQYEAVLNRPEQLSALSQSSADVSVLLDALCGVCEPVEISFLWRPILRDADDEMVLEAAVNGAADRLLTFNERDFAAGRRLGIVIQRPGPAWREWRIT